jgi:ArsR family transcriptional regulator
VRFLHGDLHAIPAPAASFDQALLLNVLPYAERPAAVLAEVARVLRPGGAVAIVTIDEHTHAELAAQYGHVQPGFRPGDAEAARQRAGLVVERCEVTSRERRAPHLNVVTALAHKPEGNGVLRCRLIRPPPASPRCCRSASSSSTAPWGRWCSATSSTRPRSAASGSARTART